MQNYQRIDKNEVAALVAVSPRTLFNHVVAGKASPMLAGLPAPATRGLGIPLTWIKQDILDWLESQRTFKQGEPQPTAAAKLQPRRPGRPRKLEGGA